MSRLEDLERFLVSVQALDRAMQIFNDKSNLEIKRQITREEVDRAARYADTQWHAVRSKLAELARKEDA